MNSIPFYETPGIRESVLGLFERYAVLLYIRGIFLFVPFERHKVKILMYIHYVNTDNGSFHDQGPDP